jgi:DnaD/phage-associated family protein
VRLHNRIVKAGFWNDTDLIRNFTRDERMFYQGLWQLADDSGCIEDDPWAFKLHLYPLDADILPETLIEWRDKYIHHGKLIQYTSEGKQCLYITNFHKHQTLDKPAPPAKDSVPLPEWVVWVQGDTRRTSRYVVRDVSGTSPGRAPLEIEPEIEPKPELQLQQEEIAKEHDDVVDWQHEYFKCFGKFPTIQNLRDLLDYTEPTGGGMDNSVILEAMKRTSKANTRSLEYTKTILNSWASHGVRDIADVARIDMEFRNRGKPDNTEESLETRINRIMGGETL